ncbi:hypothetical protein BHE74_00038350 [Ensete ventricosum]|nr:hypothetical protein BHE74_00038350 [Ensete ventricosum]
MRGYRSRLSLAPRDMVDLLRIKGASTSRSIGQSPHPPKGVTPAAASEKTPIIPIENHLTEKMAEALAKKCPAEKTTVAPTEKSIATWPERRPTEGGNERSSKKRKCMARKAWKGVTS